jgi:hypothetical protein
MILSPNLRIGFLILALVFVQSYDARAESTGETSDSLELDRAEWTAAFERFVSGLDDDQRGDALYAFDDDERFDLRLAPLGLEGLRIDEMSDAQWAELESLLGSVLSPSGLAKMNTIRSLEVEVAETEGGWFGFLFDGFRSAKRYFLAVFGDPSQGGSWGLRFDGHHFSFNWTAVPGKPLSVTPVFWGGQPRVVPEGLERAGLRVLVDEEERAIEFINALAPAERDLARVRFREGSGIRRPMSISGDVPLEVEAPEGVARSLLSPLQKKRLDAIIEVQLSNFAPSIAEAYRSRIFDRSGTTRFAFAAPAETFDAEGSGPLTAGDSFYYRIQSDQILIEYDNTSDEADHIHVVWRDLAGDFGADVLAEHLATQHPPAATE